MYAKFSWLYKIQCGFVSAIIIIHFCLCSNMAYRQCSTNARLYIPDDIFYTEGDYAFFEASKCERDCYCLDLFQIEMDLMAIQYPFKICCIREKYL